MDKIDQVNSLPDIFGMAHGLFFGPTAHFIIVIVGLCTGIFQQQLETLQKPLFNLLRFCININRKIKEITPTVAEKILEICKDNNIKFEDYLDLACGTGNVAVKVCKEFKNTFAVDLSDDMLNVAFEKFKANTVLFEDENDSFKETENRTPLINTYNEFPEDEKEVAIDKEEPQEKVEVPLFEEKIKINTIKIHLYF